MAPIAITEAELYDALAVAAAGSAPEHARTVAQMEAETGWAKWQIQKALRALHAAGRLTCYRVPFVGIDGRHGKVPAYTIAPAKAPAKRGRR